MLRYDFPGDVILGQIKERAVSIKSCRDNTVTFSLNLQHCQKRKKGWKTALSPNSDFHYLEVKYGLYLA